MKSGLLLVFGIWLMLSCQEIKDCGLESSTDYVIVKYYEADSVDKEVKTAAFTVVREENNSLFVVSTMADTLEDDTVSLTGLFVNPNDTLVNYIFETDSINYNLTLDYKPHLRIYYDECDPVYSYVLDTAYSSNFDSVVLINNILDRAVDTHIEVYF
ncbi:MAG: hypothetical protein JXR10_03085 [Cyclobacteriaceae bacterium]